MDLERLRSRFRFRGDALFREAFGVSSTNSTSSSSISEERLRKSYQYNLFIDHGYNIQVTLAVRVLKKSEKSDAQRLYVRSLPPRQFMLFILFLFAISRGGFRIGGFAPIGVILVSFIRWYV